MIKLKNLKFKEMVIPRKAYLFLVLGIFFVVLGIAANFVVMTENDGKMPVWSDFNFDSDRHFRIYDVNDVNYLHLADIWEVWGSILSIGDLLMAFGVFLWIMSGLVYTTNIIINVILWRQSIKKK